MRRPGRPGVSSSSRKVSPCCARAIAMPASSAARPGADTGTPTGCISRCMPMACTGWPTLERGPTSRAISFGIGRPWRTMPPGWTASPSPGAAVCEAFDTSGEWAWVRGRYGEITRTIVAGPAYLLDVMELASRSEHVLELPWHFAGTGDVGRGRWTSGELADEFVSRVEKLVPEGAAPLVLELAAGPRVLKAFLSFDGELVRAEGPGRPGDEKRATFY